MFKQRFLETKEEKGKRTEKVFPSVRKKRDMTEPERVAKEITGGSSKGSALGAVWRTRNVIKHAKTGSLIYPELSKEEKKLAKKHISGEKKEPSYKFMKDKQVKSANPSTRNGPKKKEPSYKNENIRQPHSKNDADKGVTKKGKFAKYKTEKEASDKNSTDKDTIDKKSWHHGSKAKGVLKKGKEEKISTGYKNGKVSGARLKPKNDPAFSKKTSDEERRELLRKKYRG